MNGGVLITLLIVLLIGVLCVNWKLRLENRRLRGGERPPARRKP